MRRLNTETVDGYKLVIGYLGYITMLAGFIALLPLLTLFFYPEEVENAKYFIFPGVISVLMGYILSFPLKGRKKGRLLRNQDAIIVLFAWMIGIFVCALPFVLLGKYNFVQAIFEAASGFSTTGLSIVDVTNAPKIFLMHRSNMLFFGGVGLVLVVMSVLSDVYGMRLYNAEGHMDRLIPNLIKSARMVMSIYAGYIASGTVLYCIFGMELFDAFNHSIAAISTGGFSTKATSIGYYNSPMIEFITIILMLLGATSFLVHLLLLRGKFKAFFQHCEVKLMLFIVAFACPIFVVLLLNGLVDNVPLSIRVAIFQIVSAITTTGFQTVESFNNWTSTLMFLMIILMLIGGGAGSTAGGIKQYRAYLLAKQLYWYIRDMASHKRAIRSDSLDRFGERMFVGDKDKKDANMFIFFYLLIFVLGSLIFTCFGYPLEQAMFEFASALGTVGLSVGITNFDAHPIVLWTATCGMLVGRLEIYVILLSIVRIVLDTKEKMVDKCG